MHRAVVRHVLYPLQERLMGRPTFRLLRALERSQWLPIERLRVVQAIKLARLLRQAGQTCPLYRDVFESPGGDPLRQRPFDVLSRLPLMDKQTVRKQVRTASRRHRRVKAMSTGGSTGEPLTFFVDPVRSAYDKAARMRSHRWFGVEPGDREAYLWGAPIANRRQDCLRSARDRLLNDLLLSAFDLSPDTTRRYLERLRRFDPVCLFGYPSSLVKLCAFARRANDRGEWPSLRCIFVTGEVLDDQQRAVLSEFFGVPVANGYGGRDSGFCAHECPHGTMHVTSEHVLMEIVDGAGRPVPRGNSGEIVVTNLDNLATPFIRYRTGDIGRLLDYPCPCGRGLEVMDVVSGRRTDHLVAADGSLRHALSVIYLLRELPDVEQFQIRQRRDRSIDIHLVAGRGLDESTRTRVVRGVHRCLGETLTTTLHMVDTIDTPPSGKSRHVISEAAEP